MRLTLTGPNGRSYVLGDPIEVYDEETLIGRVLSVTTSANGSEVRIKNFWTVDFGDFRAKALPKLVLAEVVTFIADRSVAISAIGIELNRALEEYKGNEARLATARSETLQSIGARDIRITPKPNGTDVAHFSVSGIWHYDSVSVAALAQALGKERAAYRDRKAASSPASRKGRFGNLFRRGI
ncbi:hypothetical protein [Variovorax rhizosphaerae]|uniref:Uncharacterized protein n=1 Tax=Variovorax rhizosphaerae TaxID=1836200 RepID=A0ABU8WZ85_9BURK